MDSLELLTALDGSDEDILLYDYIINTKNRIYHYLDREKGVFDLEKLSDSYCYEHFRFYKDDIRKLVRLFKLPRSIKLKSRVRVSGEEALCILLHRLSYPKRYVDQMKFFPRGRSALGEIFNYMVDYISKEKGSVLKDFNQPFMSQHQMDIFCNQISEKGSPYKRCFGFVDGTVRAICRPTTEQREFYNGHKRIHSIKFQSVMLPNGIIFNLFGSVI